MVVSSVQVVVSLVRVVVLLVQVVVSLVQVVVSLYQVVALLVQMVAPLVQVAIPLVYVGARATCAVVEYEKEAAVQVTSHELLQVAAACEMLNSPSQPHLQI